MLIHKYESLPGYKADILYCNCSQRLALTQANYRLGPLFRMLQLCRTQEKN